MNNLRSELLLQNPQGYEIDFSLLQEFEQGLDPLHPEANKIPCTVLGYGEIGTTFALDVEGMRELAFKRMCLFSIIDEAQSYVNIYQEYNQRLESEIGLHIPPYGYLLLLGDENRPIFYIIQKKLPSASIGNNAIHHLSRKETVVLFKLVLNELDKAWLYNRLHPDAAVGIDGQISNWAIDGFDPDNPCLGEGTRLLYFDTSTPLFRVNGVEQLNPELLLRSAPPYLVWILRLLFLKDVMNRYYNARKVIVDLIANFYKEQKSELIPNLVSAANTHISGAIAPLGLKEITEKEVADYYREDKVIWSMYLGMRKFDRSVHRKLGRLYPYILPGEVERESEIKGPTKSDIIEKFSRHVSSGKADFYAQAGIDFVTGNRDGVYICDLDGKRLINCHSNGGVFNLGHHNPLIIAALQKALTHYDIGNHHLMSQPRAILAERLAMLSPGDINRVVFGVSGGEAIDLALKLARAHTGRPEIISALGGYHGHTGLAMAAGDEAYRKPFEPLSPGFIQVPFGDLGALETAMGDDTAAVIFETIPATLGIVIPPEDFYAGVRKLCDRWGAVMIMDEVQTGLGRCGQVWGIDTYGVTPDIIVTAKGLSGGIYPISATLYSDRLNDFFHANPFIHISTFGGSEVGCFAALEVLDILQSPGFLEHIRNMAAIFESGFARLKEKHPHVLVEARQRGLMMGLKLVDPRCGPWMTVAGFQAGILTIFANNNPSVIQVLPPLIIQEDEANQVLAILDSMLSGLEATFQ